MLLFITTLCTCFYIAIGTPPAVNRQVVFNSGILLKCQNSDKSFPILKKSAEKSNYLKRIPATNNEPEIVIPGDDCLKGLPIVTVKTAHAF